MTRRKNLTYTAAIDLLVEARVITDRSWYAGGRDEISIGEDTIVAKNGLFARSDVTRLIGYTQMDQR